MVFNASPVKLHARESAGWFFAVNAAKEKALREHISDLSGDKRSFDMFRGLNFEQIAQIFKGYKTMIRFYFSFIAELATEIFDINRSKLDRKFFLLAIENLPVPVQFIMICLYNNEAGYQCITPKNGEHGNMILYLTKKDFQQVQKFINNRIQNLMSIDSFAKYTKDHHTQLLSKNSELCAIFWSTKLGMAGIGSAPGVLCGIKPLLKMNSYIHVYETHYEGFFGSFLRGSTAKTTAKEILHLKPEFMQFDAAAYLTQVHYVLFVLSCYIQNYVPVDVAFGNNIQNTVPYCMLIDRFYQEGVAGATRRGISKINLRDYDKALDGFEKYYNSTLGGKYKNRFAKILKTSAKFELINKNMTEKGELNFVALLPNFDAAPYIQKFLG